jgi:hypothetical protein
MIYLYMAVDNVAGNHLEGKIPCSDCTHKLGIADIQIVHVASYTSLPSDG